MIRVTRSHVRELANNDKKRSRIQEKILLLKNIKKKSATRHVAVMVTLDNEAVWVEDDAIEALILYYEDKLDELILSEKEEMEDEET